VSPADERGTYAAQCARTILAATEAMVADEFNPAALAIAVTSTAYMMAVSRMLDSGVDLGVVIAVVENDAKTAIDTLRKIANITRPPGSVQ
jgi:hypothetical protein